MGGPISLCVDREDRVWVSATNNRVQQFTNDEHWRSNCNMLERGVNIAVPRLNTGSLKGI